MAPITNREDGAAARLRTVVIIEAVVAAVVLGVASVLVQTTPARTAVTQTEAPAIQDAVMPDRLFTLTVDMQPSTVGQNEIHMYATTPDGQPSDVQEWRVRASMPSEGIEAIDAAILRPTPRPPSTFRSRAVGR